MPAWCSTPTLCHGCLHWQYTFCGKAACSASHAKLGAARMPALSSVFTICSMKVCALLCTPGMGNTHTYICNSQSGSSSVHTVCIQCNSRSCSRSIHTSHKDLSLQASYQSYVHTYVLIEWLCVRWRKECMCLLLYMPTRLFMCEGTCSLLT